MPAGFMEHIYKCNKNDSKVMRCKIKASSDETRMKDQSRDVAVFR